MRDISKVMQGCCAADSKSTNTTVDIVRLWVHENQRVYGDRMINYDDKGCLVDLMVPEMEKFKLKREDIFNVERLIYGDYMQGIDGENRPYVQVQDI